MKIPRATYRLQFTPSFRFQEMHAILDYLCDLGISDIYASPIMTARSQSEHGYDVIDPTQLNPELGGDYEFGYLIKAVHERGMGWVQDIVPNHMAFDSQNRMLMDIFESGPLSKYYEYFDIDWDHPYNHLKGRVLAPFLGEFYGKCFDKNQIQICLDASGFTVRYYDFVFPLRIDSYVKIMIYNLADLDNRIDRLHDDYMKYLELTQMIKDVESVADYDERYRRIMLIKTILWKLYTSNHAIKVHIDTVLGNFNSPDKDPQVAVDFDNLLSDQYFRFSFWKVGNEELNYRRFFTINGMLCLNVEHEGVFEHVHGRVFKLLKENEINGIRIDHIDGLYDPHAYLNRIRERYPDAYILVEKILDLRENLPSDFPVNGTTGYDALNYINSILVDRSNAKKMTQAYISFTGVNQSYHELVYEKKLLFLGKYMAGDIDNLGHLLRNILNRTMIGRDMTVYSVNRTLVEIMAHFPVYRTYLCEHTVHESDITYITQALEKAKRKNPGLLYAINCIEKILLLDFDPKMNEEEKEQWIHFTKRFQQYTGPLMAKGAEDTTFYIYNPLVSLNEVGGNPSFFGIRTRDFHAFFKRRFKHWPNAMNTTATHDTKRGEDLRARINVLSELPRDWRARFRSWHKMNKHHKGSIGSVKVPEKNDEYFIYQNLLGGYPFYDDQLDSFKQRMKDYIVKAIREAKIHTAWIKPDDEYEQGCIDFIDAILDTSSDNEFPADFEPFQRQIAWFGMLNSLSQVILKNTLPGVPDLYQGSELWDFSFVDPDNRRPVDFEHRKHLLEKIRSRLNDKPSLIKELFDSFRDGAIKLFLIHQLLHARADHSEIFENGAYIPLETKGKWRDHVIAFARKVNGSCAVVVVPRLFSALIDENKLPLGTDVWQNTTIDLSDIEADTLTESITGNSFGWNKSMQVGDLFAVFPGAVLIGDKKS